MIDVCVCVCLCVCVCVCTCIRIYTHTPMEQRPLRVQHTKAFRVLPPQLPNHVDPSSRRITLLP